VPLLEVRQNYFHPVGANGSIFLTADGGTSFGAKHTDLLGFSLGGPFRMGAFGRNELLGNQYYLFQAGYDRQIGRLNPLIGEGVYVVAFAEAGKVYGSRTAPVQPVDGSLAIVVNSALGPMYIGGSVGNNGHAKWWFGLGRIF
jgi:NTE family protein